MVMRQSSRKRFSSGSSGGGGSPPLGLARVATTVRRRLPLSLRAYACANAMIII